MVWPWKTIVYFNPRLYCRNDSKDPRSKKRKEK